MIDFIKFIVYRLSMLIDNLGRKWYVAITIIDNLKIASSDNDNR